MNYALLLCIFSILIVIVVNFLSSNFKILIYKPNLIHKEKFENKIYNTGGLIFFLYLIILYLINDDFYDFNSFLFLTLTFSIGFFSDIRENFNANLRLIFISLCSVIYIIVSNNLILDLKFNIINDLFANYPIFSIFFTSICLVILINGLNFIDGVHGLVLLYGILILIILNYFVYYKLDFENSLESGLIIIPILSILLIFNLNEKIFFGDAGSYLLGAIIGLYIIKLTNSKGYSHPYFYANLLIYPAYEVFFSILRKIINKKGPYQPDQKHLHHLIQRIYQLKYNYNLTKSKIYSAISVNFFILLFNLISISFYQNKYILISNIFIFMIFYTFVYFHLNKKLK
tara:strand:- start:1100 stop:2131 length:1032 start_codon:yes stop_codon:yes gene_type:complete